MMLFTIARQELKIISRSKWVFSFAALYTILAITIVVFGGSAVDSGFDGFSRMTASLLNLSLFLVPLLTLLIGSSSIAGDKEDGSLLLLFTYPTKHTTILVGKFLGLFLTLFSVISLGYGMAGLVSFFSSGSLSLDFLLLFYGFTLLLMVLFLSLAILIGVITTTRFQALGLSLVVWAVAVLFYEFVIMGVAMFISKQAVLGMFTISILLNPIELIRVWTIISMDSGSIFGPHLYDFTVWSEGLVGQLAFSVSALVWIVVPILLSNLLLKRGLRHG